MKKFIFGFILGAIIFSGIGVIAYSIYSKDVAYDNTNSGSGSTNVQDAIDELYEVSGGKLMYDTITVNFAASNTYNTLVTFPHKPIAFATTNTANTAVNCGGYIDYDNSVVRAKGYASDAQYVSETQLMFYWHTASSGTATITYVYLK